MAIIQPFGVLAVQIAATHEESEAIWQVRRSVSPSLRKVNPDKFNEDIVVPRSKVPEMIRALEEISARYRRADRQFRPCRRRQYPCQYHGRSAGTRAWRRRSSWFWTRSSMTTVDSARLDLRRARHRHRQGQIHGHGTGSRHHRHHAADQRRPWIRTISSIPARFSRRLQHDRPQPNDASHGN